MNDVLNKNTNKLGQNTLKNRAWCSELLLSQKRGHLQGAG